MSGQNDEILHNLFTREIRPTRNWKEWRERWQAAVTIEEMVGLLHFGFDVPLECMQHGEQEYDNIDRLSFYFNIADGWAEHRLLRRETDDNRSYMFGQEKDGCVAYKRIVELREFVARKAFEVLCSHFFKMELMGGGRDGHEFGYGWKHVATSERLYPVLQNFFRVEEGIFGGQTNTRNLNGRWCERSHNEQQAVNFLLNLARFMW